MVGNSTDRAVRNREEDTLGRYDYAEIVANKIVDTHTWEDSAVFGLTGSWGSGKTSMVNMIETVFGKLHPTHKVVRFTPWATSDVTGVLGDFYTSLVAALPWRHRRKVRRKFAAMLRVAAPAGKLFPIAGDIVTSATTATAELLAKEESWDAAFHKAARALVKSNVPILVIIDDVDRLQGHELLSVLKVIRLLGRFPGVQYLLAYDQEAMTYTLRSAGAVRNRSEGRRYIEKVVQYPFPVPPLLEVQQIEWLDNRLEAVIRKNRKVDAAMEWMQRVDDAREQMKATLLTPRAIEQFALQVDFDLALHQVDEIDDQDVIIVALLRTVYPSVYASLTAYQNELISGAEPSTRLTSVQRWDPSPALAGVRNQAQPRAREILCLLFPRLQDDRIQISPDTKRICTSEYFGRYFAMGVLDKHDIADSAVCDAMINAGDGMDARLRELLFSGSTPFVRLVLDKMRRTHDAAVADLTTHGRDQSILALTTSLMSIHSHLPQSNFSALPLDPRDRLLQWIGETLLWKLSSGVEPVAVSHALVNGAVDLPTRLDLISAAARPMQGEEPAWLVVLIDSTFTDASNALCSNLRRRNAADTVVLDHEVNHFMNFFQIAYNFHINLGQLRTQIAVDIDRDMFDLGDLAARCVYRVGDRLKPDQSMFALLAPTAESDWYNQEPRVLEPEIEAGGSMSARRDFAAGRFLRPSEE